MTSRHAADRLLAEHAAALDDVRARIAAADRAAALRAHQLRCGTTVEPSFARAGPSAGRVLRRADESRERDRSDAEAAATPGAPEPEADRVEAYRVKSWLV